MNAAPTREVVLLVAVLIVAAALRIIGLNASLWYDEVFTLTHFVRLPWSDLVGELSSLNNHMLYSLEAKAAVSVFGETAWALRLPAVVFALGSLVLVWRMGRQLAGPAAALLATFLLAVSYHHVWFSQNARGYTELLFWTMLATMLFVHGLERPRLGSWTGYAAAFAAGMYTHLSAGFFFAAHAVVYAIACIAARRAPGRPLSSRYPGLRSWQPLYGFAAAVAVTALLYAPLLAATVRTIGRVAARSQPGVSSLPEWASPVRTLQEIAASVGDLGALAPLGIAAGVLLIVIGAVDLYRRSPLLVAVYAVHVPLCIALLWLLSFRIWPRYFFVDIGFVFLCVAAGIVAVTNRAAAVIGLAPGKWTARAPLAIAVALATCASLVLLARNYAHPKQDFAGAVAFVERTRGTGDVATSTGLAAEPLRSYFAPSWPVAQNAAELQALLAAAPHVWLVTAFQSHTERRRPDVMALVQQRFDLVARFPGTLGEGTVRVYRSR